MTRYIYADGGVIGRNPSSIGGTWAYVLTQDDEVLKECSNVVTPEQIQMPAVSNNVTELIAVVRGLAAVPFDWYGTIASDSEITLGRVFRGWHRHNVPDWLSAELDFQIQMHIKWNKINGHLLQGHPTRLQLLKGMGDRYPVSKHNVRCDQLCGIEAKKYLIENTHPIGEF